MTVSELIIELQKLQLEGRGAFCVKLEPQWSPIATAPKDGTRVILLQKDGTYQNKVTSVSVSV